MTTWKVSDIIQKYRWVAVFEVFNKQNTIVLIILIY